MVTIQTGQSFILILCYLILNAWVWGLYSVTAGFIFVYQLVTSWELPCKGEYHILILHLLTCIMVFEGKWVIYGPADCMGATWTMLRQFLLAEWCCILGWCHFTSSGLLDMCIGFMGLPDGWGGSGKALGIRVRIVGVSSFLSNL